MVSNEPYAPRVIYFIFLRGRKISRGSYDRTGYQISFPSDWALIELNKLDNMIFAMLQMKQKLIRIKALVSNTSFVQ